MDICGAWRRIERPSGFHVITKPIGPICNLRCAYCFYIEKTALYPDAESWRMTDETLAAFVRQYFEAQPPKRSEPSTSRFRGGEPTLMGGGGGGGGARFLPPSRGIAARIRLRKASRRKTRSKRTESSSTTRGANFSRENRFLVGISLDGPAPLHDAFRVDPAGQGTHARVVAALRRGCKSMGSNSIVLTCVNRKNAAEPVAVYRAPPRAGGESSSSSSRSSNRLPPDPDVNRRPSASDPSAPSNSAGFSRENLRRMDSQGRWEHLRPRLRRSAGRVGAANRPRSASTRSIAGRALALEHNGDLYACDHFVDEKYRLGNIHERPLVELVEIRTAGPFRPEQGRFAPGMSAWRCEYLRLCRGGCPKDRIVETPICRQAVELSMRRL